jgi:threonine/homoserine/homoserine lactone efflux protein
MKKMAWLGCVLLLLLAFSSCAPGPNSAEKTADQEGKTAGFWLGLWHGLISPITFIVSVFSKTVDIYEVHNSGSWYNFGFVLGAGLFLQGGILGSRKARKKR